MSLISSINIPKNMIESVDDAVIRAQYLFPTLRITREQDIIRIESDDPFNEGECKRDLHYLIYREHIRKKYEHFRLDVVRTVTGSAS
jgi:hypothetical protein